MAKSRNSSEQPADPSRYYLNWPVSLEICSLFPTHYVTYTPLPWLYTLMFFIPSHNHTLRGADCGRKTSEALPESSLPITTAHLPMLPSPALTKLPQTHFLRCSMPDHEALFSCSETAGLYNGADTFHIL